MRSWLPAAAEAITAVFDLRTIDDSVDLEPDETGRAALERWRAEIARVWARARDRPGRGLQPFVSRAICRANNSRRSSRAWGWICAAALPVSPSSSPTAPGRFVGRAHALRSPGSGSVRAHLRSRSGVALQLTNILRDVGVDYQRGVVICRWTTGFGCTEADLAREAARRRRDWRTRPHLARPSAARAGLLRAARALPNRRPRFTRPRSCAPSTGISRRSSPSLRCLSRVVRVPKPAQAGSR